MNPDNPSFRTPEEVQRLEMIKTELAAERERSARLLEALKDVTGVRCSECDGGEHIIEQIRDAIKAHEAEDAKETK